MILSKPKIIAVLGPTSVGKTSVALDLAKKFDGEIVSADSRQIYRHLDIATGKPTNEELDGIPYHLIDFLDPKEKFSAGEYKKKAEGTIDRILNFGKLPILEGGGGFYLDAVARGIKFPEVKADEKLRRELEEKDIKELMDILKNLDKNHFTSIYRSKNKNNRRRIIRAIEVARALGLVPKLEEDPKYNVLYIGIDLDDENLKKRIKERIERWIKAGLIDEGEILLDMGITRERLNELGLEYRILGSLLYGDITLDEMKERMAIETFQYVKRQRTWFKRNKDVNWFRPREMKAMEKEVGNFLS